MKFCEHCGKRLKEDGLFCEHCGAKIPQLTNEEKRIEQSSSSQVKQDSHDEIPEREPIQSEKETSDSPQQKKSKKIPLILLGFLLVGGIATGGYFWMNNKPKIDSAEQSTKETKVSSSTSEINSLSETSESTKESSKESETIESTVVSDEGVKKTEISLQQIEDLVQPELGLLANPTSFYFSQIGNKDNVYSYNGTESIRSASIIKLFILDSFFANVQNGGMNLEEKYTLQSYDKVGGTGVLSTYADGYEVTYQELARLMIVESDNTAGNILINLLGGPELLTQYIREQGYSHTSLERLFLDSDALSKGYDNYTSAEDIGHLLETLYTKGPKSELNILRETKNKQKLPYAVGDDVTVYNKTGEYSDYGVENDGCIFEKDGTAYVVVFLSQDGDSNNQISAMQNIGSNIYHELLGGE